MSGSQPSRQATARVSGTSHARWQASGLSRATMQATHSSADATTTLRQRNATHCAAYAANGRSRALLFRHFQTIYDPANVLRQDAPRRAAFPHGKQPCAAAISRQAPTRLARTSSKCSAVNKSLRQHVTSETWPSVPSQTTACSQRD